MDFRRNMGWAAGLLLAIALVVGTGALPVAQAAPAVQPGTLSLTNPGPVSGTLDDATPEVSYDFTCAAGGVASVRVETTSGDLEVAITVSAADDGVLARGGVVSSEPTVSLVEAFEMPGDGACTITLARTGATAGAYDAWLLPGYAEVLSLDSFDGRSASANTWQPYASETLTVATVGERLQLQVLTDNLLGYAVPDQDVDAPTYFAQATFEIQGDPSYAEYGFIMRYSEEPEMFYALTVSSENDWALYWYDEEWLAIQEWTVSDRIDGTDRNPTVGMWVDGFTFRVYFNGAFVGEVTDTTQHAESGTLGVVAATGVDQFDTLVVYMDDVLVTVPVQGSSGAGLAGLLDATREPNDVEATLTAVAPSMTMPTPTAIPPTPVPPSPAAQVVDSWASGSEQAIVRELQAMGLVPTGGSIALTVPSSYGDTSSSGFSYYTLGQGNQFADFVLAFDARLVTTGPESGCGMYLRDSANYSVSALTFEDGSFLLGEWGADGNLSDNSVYAFDDIVMPGEGATNNVIVVANGPDVWMFVNGYLVAETTFQAAQGGVALEMYVQEDDFGSTVQTYCQLNDIWLWQF